MTRGLGIVFVGKMMRGERMGHLTQTVLPRRLRSRRLVVEEKEKEVEEAGMIISKVFIPQAVPFFYP